VSHAAPDLPADRPYFDPVVQTLPLERVRALQWERLARQLDRVWDTPVPFFKKKYEAAGIQRADVRSLDDLRHLPATVKNELRASEEAFPPFGDYRGAPPSAAVRLGASTGTSGRPTLILWTRKDLHVDHLASSRGRWRWGLRPGMSLANAHPFGMNAGGWHFSHGVEALGALNIPSGPPVGAQHVADVLEVWRRVRPDMYRLFGNVATTYADAARARGIDPVTELNLTIAGDHPAEQYLRASSGLRWSRARRSCRSTPRSCSTTCRRCRRRRPSTRSCARRRRSGSCTCASSISRGSTSPRWSGTWPSGSAPGSGWRPGSSWWSGGSCPGSPTRRRASSTQKAVDSGHSNRAVAMGVRSGGRTHRRA
jgi:hypothetical protein